MKGMPAKGIPTARKDMQVLMGDAAIREVERSENRQLSDAEKRVVEVEGYVPHCYYDGKGILTYGVGQTGEYISKPFSSSFEAHVERAKRRFGDWDTFPSYLKTELIQSEYRGDLGLSPTAVKHINAGHYDKAADEFLDNAEYKNKDTSSGIKARMKATADALRQLHKERK